MRRVSVLGMVFGIYCCMKLMDAMVENYELGRVIGREAKRD